METPKLFLTQSMIELKHLQHCLSQRAKHRDFTHRHQKRRTDGASLRERLFATTNFHARMIATHEFFLHHIGVVTRFGSKLVAVFLLCSAVLLGSQMLLPSTTAASAIPAPCHNHGQPARTPTSHQCCVVSHNPSIVETYSPAQSLHDFSSYVVTEPSEGNRSYERLFFTPSFSSSSPPITTPLRV